MKTRVGILALALFVLLSQANALAQKKESAKTTKDKKVQSRQVAEEKADRKAKEKKAEAGEKEQSKSEDPVVGKTKDGKPVYEGARGGFYYLTEGKNKAYVKDFVGAKVVGKTPDGYTIYEGPRGGHFYYNDSGNKMYIKKK